MPDWYWNDVDYLLPVLNREVECRLSDGRSTTGVIIRDCIGVVEWKLRIMTFAGVQVHYWRSIG